MASFAIRRVARQPLPLLRRGTRGIITPASIKYTASATATGGGRDGKVKINNDAVAPLDEPIKLGLAKGLGGNGGGTNPEQLFSAGYSACFLGALQAAARNLGKSGEVKNATVEVKTHIGPTTELPGFALVVDLVVSGVKDQKIVDAAHEICPYSKALTHGVKVSTTLA